MKHHVTFEQAEWLMEKGFYLEGYLQKVWLGNSYKQKKNGAIIVNSIYGLGASSKLPEQHQVVEWLRVNHGIWVYVNFSKGKWYYYLQDLSHTDMDEEDCRFYNMGIFSTPQEAYSAAFDYIRNNNLISRHYFIADAEWQAERMYTEEDMREAIRFGFDKGFCSNSRHKTKNLGLSEQEWFEQLKKK
jgi:hypothetical protein